VTVFQRCEAKGYTDYVTSSMVGQLMADWYTRDYLLADNREKVESIEPHGTFTVWAYPDEHAPVIDRFIGQVNSILNKDLKLPSEQALIDSVKPKRKRINE